MQSVTCQCAPRFGDNRQVHVAVYQSIVQCPGHTVGKKRCTARFFATEMGRIVQARVPEAICTLQRYQCQKHVFQVLLVFVIRSEEHTSELQSLMRISYAVSCLKKKKHNH